jgi:hypothetical protein
LLQPNNGKVSLMWATAAPFHLVFQSLSLANCFNSTVFWPNTWNLIQEAVTSSVIDRRNSKTFIIDQDMNSRPTSLWRGDLRHNVRHGIHTYSTFMPCSVNMFGT